MKISTGNGGLLLFPIDLPYTDANYSLLDQLATYLADRFNDADCDVDTAVMKDPSRVLGVVGTVNRSKAESPIEDRIAKVREVVGDYPPNVPIAADAFIAAAKALLPTTDILNANAVADTPTAAPTPTTPQPKSMPCSSTDGGWATVSDNRVARARAYLAKLDDAVSGQKGHVKFFQAACSLFRFGLSDADAATLLNEFNATKCQPPFPQRDVEHKLQQAKMEVLKSGEWEKLMHDVAASVKADSHVHSNSISSNQSSSKADLTDIGLARRFLAKYGDHLLYATAWKAWLVWDGRRWIRDDGDSVRRQLIDFIRFGLLFEAQQIEDADQRANFFKWVAKEQHAPRIDGALSIARSMKAIDVSELDRNGNLFNCHNGTLELDTLKFREHRRADKLTKISTVIYDPSATAPKWQQFLERIFQDTHGEPRKEIIEFVQRASGYSLTANIGEQCLFILHGGGANGKTTLMSVLKMVMGEYAMNALPTTVLQIGQQQRNNDDEADLFGMRLVAVSEVDEGQKFAVAKIKRLVGSSRTIRAMRKFEQSFEFEPTHKIWLDVNHLPRVSQTDDGVWRRMRVIPFIVQIPTAERIKDLDLELMQESSGILNWILHGLQQWRANGLGMPSEVQQAVNDYKGSSDTFGNFLADRIVPNDAAKTPTAFAYSAYLQWAEDNGMGWKLDKIQFGRKMAERNYQSKVSNGTRFFMGCEVLSADATAEDEVEVDADDDRPF